MKTIKKSTAKITMLILLIMPFQFCTTSIDEISLEEQIANDEHLLEFVNKANSIISTYESYNWFNDLETLVSYGEQDSQESDLSFLRTDVWRNLHMNLNQAAQSIYLIINKYPTLRNLDAEELKDILVSAIRASDYFGIEINEMNQRTEPCDAIFEVIDFLVALSPVICIYIESSNGLDLGEAIYCGGLYFVFDLLADYFQEVCEELAG